MLISLTVFFYLLFQMTLVWVVYRVLKNPSVVDVAWSLGLMISGFVYLWSVPSTARTLLVSSLLTLWGLRLAGFLWYTRIRLGHSDKRYTEISTGWKINQSLGFFLNFQLQGFLIFFISFIFYLISTSTTHNLTGVDAIALLTVLIGIAGESLADVQLYHFKARHKGVVCNIGLWKFSRHPNYFFDWFTWLGFTLFAFQSNHGYLGLGSLLVLYVIFTKITGPITERSSVQSRGQEYITYQQHTSMFFPWFKVQVKQTTDSQ